MIVPQQIRHTAFRLHSKICVHAPLKPCKSFPARYISTSRATMSSERSFKISNPPNPSWTFGQKVDASAIGREWLEGEKAGWKTIDTSTADSRTLYRLMIGGIVPRPVAFVSTVSENGVGNLAPFSWFNQVSSSPPVISVSCMRSADHMSDKDTVRNIKATKGYTVNIISEPWVAQANAAAVDAPPEFSEWPVTGLTKEPSIHVKAPRVKESAFSMECELLQTVDITDPSSGKVTTTLVLGSVKYIHVRNDILDEKGRVDPAKLQPVARMGGTLYARIKEGFNIERHSWRKHEKDIRDVTPKENSS